MFIRLRAHISFAVSERRERKLKNRKTVAIAVFTVVFLAFGLASALIPLIEKWYDRVDNYRDICVHEAYAIITYQSYRSPFILDVRREGEFNGTESPGHIANAINIPHDQLVDNLSDPVHCPLIGHEGDTIIVYCKTGGRSANASEVLAIDGFQIVYNMVGGMDMWVYSGYPVVTEAPPTYTDITVHEAWDMINSGSYPDLIILDVRTTGYSLEHIEGAISIPYYNDADFESRLGPLSGHEYHEIIVYCQNLACPLSPAACEYLVDHGFTKVYNMFEGIEEWKAEGYPVWTPPPPEDFVFNPSVEDGTISPDYWTASKYADVLGENIWSDAIMHTGERSLRINIRPNPSGVQWHGIGWTQRHNLDSSATLFERGKTYNLTAWYKTLDGYVTIWVGFYDAGGNWLSQAYREAVVAAGDWASCPEIVFTVPNDAKYIAIGCMMRLQSINAGATEASSWVDDFKVQQVS